jgi:hypothetical protein
MINNYPYPMYPTQNNAYPTNMNVGSTQQNVGTMQNGGFISIPNENMVATYPVAPGNCVTFKVEGQPIVLEKSMGFSQLESPRIERYRLVKEDYVEETSQNETKTNELEEIKSDIERLWDEIDALKPKKTTRRSTNGDD